MSKSIQPIEWIFAFIGEGLALFEQILTTDLAKVISQNLSMAFKLPMAITDLEGKIIEQVHHWRNPTRMMNPGWLETLKETSGQSVVVVPMLEKNQKVGYLLADLSQKRKSEHPAMVAELTKALADIGMYKPRTSPVPKKLDISKLLKLLQKGAIAHDEAIRQVLDMMVTEQGVDCARLEYLDESQGKSVIGYVCSNEETAEYWTEDCSLPSWALEIKEPIFVSSPVHDSRCDCINSRCNNFKLIMCWPLFLRNRSLGSLKLGFFDIGNQKDLDIDTFAQLSVLISHVLHDYRLAEEGAERSRKVTAINELMAMIKSSLNIDPILKLAAKLIMNIGGAQQVTISIEDVQHRQHHVNLQQSAEELGWTTDGGLGFKSELHAKGKGKEVAGEPLVLPIISSQRSVGNLTVQGLGLRVSPANREFLNTIAQLLGLAVQSCMGSKSVAEDTVRALEWSLRLYNKAWAEQAQINRKWIGEFVRFLEFSDDEIQTIQWAGQLQDIGKINSFRSDSPNHVLIGEKMLSEYASLQGVAQLVRYHHELYDGSGYPDGLRGEEIPLGARIIVLINDFLSGGQVPDCPGDYWRAFDQLARRRGSWHDPGLVTAFKVYLEELCGSQDAAYWQERQRPVVEQRISTELGLTPRELEILSYLGTGMSNGEIAQELFLSEKTVKTHITRIFKKLQVTDRTKAALFALQQGLVQQSRSERSKNESNY